jgi:hypothetical protein
MGTIKHAKTSTIPAPLDTSRINGPDWNQPHEFDLAPSDIEGLEARLIPVDQVVAYRDQALAAAVSAGESKIDAQAFAGDAAASADEAAATLAAAVKTVDLAAPTGAGLVGWEGGNVSDLRLSGANTGAALIPFLPPEISVAFQSSQEKMRDTVTLYDFGAFGDGNLYTVAAWIIPGVKGKYPNLAAVQVDYPFVTATTDDANWAALMKAEAYAVASGMGRVNLGRGNFAYSKTWQMGPRGVTVAGIEGAQALGAGLMPSMMTWKGGAEPMIRVAATRFRFKDFAVKNEGTATDFMELNSGAQSFHWERLYCITTGHTPFSRAFIRSNGNRVGYSHMRECLIGSVAPTVFEIDGQGTANAITNLIIDGRCIFTSDTAPLTVVKLIEEGIESLTIRDCTFNQYQGELVIVDTRTVSYARPIDVLIFQGNEQDALPASDQALWRNFKLTNVSQILFDGNKLSGGGTKTFLADLVNSHVVSARGNYFGSLATALFNCDDASTVRGFYSHGTGVGRNVITNRRAGIVQLAYGPGISIDGRNLDQSKHEAIYLDVTNGSGYTINVDNGSPEFWCIGQIFTLVIRNTSAGAVSVPVFGATFNTQGAAVAPAIGFSRSFTFVWDGTKAIEIARSVSDVANT